MPRPIPEYKWPITEGEPLKAEAHSHRMKGKAGGKTFKQAKPPVALPKQSQGVTDVHYGSHAKVAHAIGEEMRRLGL